MYRLRKKLTSRLEEKGQGMTEYIIIVALIAILSIGVITVFGNQIRDWFGVGTKQLSGQETSTVKNRSDKADGEIERKFDSLVE